MAKYKETEQRTLAYFPIVWAKQGVWAPIFWGDGPILLDSVQWESTGFNRDNSVTVKNGGTILRMPVLRVTAVSTEGTALGWRPGDFAAIDSVAQPSYGLGEILGLKVSDAGPRFDAYSRPPAVALKVVPIDYVGTNPQPENPGNPIPQFPPAYQDNSQPSSRIIYAPPATVQTGIDLNTILALDAAGRPERIAAEERRAAREERREAEERRYQERQDEREAEERRERRERQERKEQQRQKSLRQQKGRKDYVRNQIDPEDDEEDEDFDDDLL